MNLFAIKKDHSDETEDESKHETFFPQVKNQLAKNKNRLNSRAKMYDVYTKIPPPKQLSIADNVFKKNIRRNNALNNKTYGYNNKDSLINSTTYNDMY